jgi:hypothetical protein
MESKLIIGERERHEKIEDAIFWGGGSSMSCAFYFRNGASNVEGFPTFR